jgi:hypothetical protein
MGGQGAAVTETAYHETVCELRVLLAEPPKLGKGALPHMMGRYWINRTSAGNSWR